MRSTTHKILPPIAVALGLVLGVASHSHPQRPRQIKVLVESQQSGTQSQESLQGSGSVIIRRGNAYPSGRITGNDRQTTVQRSTGIFTLVQDGGESILSVATQVPYSQAAYYYNYAVGSGYIQRQIVFTDVGTSLRVSASVLADNQIRVRLTPRISYFSAERSGAIDFTERRQNSSCPADNLFPSAARRPKYTRLPVRSWATEIAPARTKPTSL
jgi:hypothetical protein